MIITATIQNRFGWSGTFPEGWTMVDATTETLMVTFDTVGCTTPTPTPTPSVSKTPVNVTGLPITGTQGPTVDGGNTDTILLILAASLMAAAAAAFVGTRKPRS